MNLEKQCCAIEYAEQLKKLGITQQSLFYHTHSDWGILPAKSIDFNGNPTSAFTCAEIVQMLNGDISNIHFSFKKNKFYCWHTVDTSCFYNTFADALAAKLIESIKNKWVTIKDANKRLVE